MTNQPELGGDPSAQGSQRAVFLSYASEDAQDAQRICASLRAAGVEVWFDRNELRGGDAWDQSIRRQIRECALFIPVISSHTQARPEGYFRLEWRLADQRTHLMGRNRAFIVPVCVDGTAEVGADVPDSFMAAQWTRLPSGDTPSAFCSRVAALLDGSATAPPAAPSAGPTSRFANARKPVLWLSLVVVIAIVGAVVAFAPDRWWGVKGRGAAAVALRPATVADVPAPEKSIAVLPFDDMSEKHDQEYFSDGLAEELIDRLAQAPDLNVVSRTSSFYFKHRPTTIAEVAKALGISNVVEGSVRKSGQTLRITAQLIRAADGFHLWSQARTTEV